MSSWIGPAFSRTPRAVLLCRRLVFRALHLFHPHRCALVYIMPANRAIDYYGPDEAESYRVGQTLPLTLADGSTCTATVLRAFLPVTQSLVLLVSVEGCAALEHPVILKIYDPRYMKNRKAPPPHDRPWSLELEIAAAERRDTVARGERVDGHETDADDDKEDEEDDESDSNESVGYDTRVLFEEELYDLAHRSFETEREVYERLHVLQGDGIPRCYASGTVCLPSPDKSRARPIQPPFLLIEYVDGPALHSVDAKLVPRGLARRLLHTIRHIESQGVVHSDLHKSNIIFAHNVTQPSRPPSAPFSRAVVIDFGQAGIRDATMDDEQWKDVLRFENDFGRVCKHLHEAGIRDESPVRPKTSPYVSTKFRIIQVQYMIIGVQWNEWAEKHQRWCEPTEEWIGFDGEPLKEPILWKLKPEAASWLENRDPDDPDPPRPGSPSARSPSTSVTE
jgi:serine/threonine protein kinase